MIVVAGPAGAGADDAALELAGPELTGPELAGELAGELADADPLAGADVAATVEAGAAAVLTAAAVLLDEVVVAAGGAALLDWLAVPCEQAVSNASSAAVPVSSVERDRRFTWCPFGVGRRRCRPWMNEGKTRNAGSARTVDGASI